MMGIITVTGTERTMSAAGVSTADIGAHSEISTAATVPRSMPRSSPPTDTARVQRKSIA